MQKIGIVTVLYNSEKVLEEFFISLNNQTYKNFILFIIDNNSQDKSLERAKLLANKSSFECIFFAEKENWGIAKGNNIGIRAALHYKCDYILLSNNDVVLPNSRTIELLLMKMDCDKQIDILCPKIFYYTTPSIFWAAGGDFEKNDTTTHHIGLGEIDKGQYDNEMLIRYTPTCFVMIRRRVFELIGLMDEKFFVYYDDTDFMYRAWKSGLKILYTPITYILHNESSSTRQGSPFQLYYFERNRLLFTKKNRSNFVFWKLVMQRILALALKNVWILPKTHSNAEYQGLRDGIKCAFKIKN